MLTAAIPGLTIGMTIVYQTLKRLHPSIMPAHSKSQGTSSKNPLMIQAVMGICKAVLARMTPYSESYRPRKLRIKNTAIKSAMLGKACRISVNFSRLCRPGKFIRDRAYPAITPIDTSRTVSSPENISKFQVAFHMFGKTEPPAVSTFVHRNLQFSRVKSVGTIPYFIWVEKEFKNSHKYMRMIGRVVIPSTP